MESRTFQLLEFPKILKALAGFAVSSAGASACLKTKPFSSDSELQSQRALYDQTTKWVRESGFTLSPFTALDGLFNFLESQTAFLDEDGLLALLEALEQAQEARESLKPFAERGWEELFQAIFGSGWPEMTFSGLKRCIDKDGRIKDQSSPELLSIRREISQIHQRCTKKAKDFIQDKGLSHYLQDEYITISSDRYVLPLKSNFKGKLQGIIHDYSQTNETCFFEPMFLVELNNKVQELKKQERDEEIKILKYLTGLIRQEMESIVACYDFLIQLDVLMAKVKLGEAIEGVCLNAKKGNPVRVVNARHPLLVLSGTDVQPMDIELLEGQKGLIISGGNAGGKTVCLKTLGLIALMAYSGLPVPVEEGSSLPLWSKIFVVMGDEQSLEDHVSTFTAQIHCLAKVWPELDQDTLFILDEFGAGTDPTQGAALAQAVIDSLLGKKTFIFAATHFPALKAYATANDEMRAASVLFDPKTKKPLFKIAYDQIGASIALDVAKEHGLPLEILEKAQQYLLLDGSDTSAVLDRLNNLAVEKEKEVKLAVKERSLLASKKRDLEARFEKERLSLLEDMRKQTQELLREWKKDKIGRKQALKKLASIRERIEPAEKPQSSAGLEWNDLKIGMKVDYPAWAKSGIIMEIDSRRKAAKVDLDGVAMWIKHRDLAPASREKASTYVSKPAISKSKPETELSLSLDLRGLRADEAIVNLERFMDAALLKGVGRLEIIHGKGTGALRREVHDFLGNSGLVSDFYLANEDRGGDGMTEVVLN